MSLKMKLTSAIIMFMLILSTLVIGVIAAESQTISMKGNVSFNIDDRSLYLKSVRYKVGNDATEPVTLENFLPGYIDANMEVNIGDHEFNYSAFTLYFDIVNTTKNTYNAVEEVTLSPELSSQGVSASASGKISPTQETDSDGDNYAEIMPTSEPTGTITLTVTSTSTQAQPINLGDITITIEQYVPRNFTQEGFTISGNSITGYIGTATDIVIPSSYKIDETTGDYIEDLDGTGTPITTIGANAFQNKMALTSITIPETVTSIGEYAFAGCTALQTIDLSNSQITSIPDRAFQGNLALTSITIPDTVISIGQYAFNGCTNLLNVNLSETSQLQTIGNYAFQNCSSLTTITIPETVTSIGSRAFSGCSSLQSVDFNNCQTTTIPDSAFSGCSSLTTITIPETVTSIRISAFSGCSSLTIITIPEGVKSIGSWAFSGCHALAIVYNNSSLTITAGSYNNGEVGLYAKEVVTDGEADGNITEENNIFYYNNETNKVALGPKGSKSSITSVTLASDTTEINRSAFEGYTSLQSVDFNNCQITTIPDEAFNNCSSLTTITIPDTVTSIGNNAFQYCSSLTTITIPEGVKSIGWDAFSNCRNLQYNTDGEGMYLGSATNPYFALIDTQTTNLTFITINQNCKIIASYAFRNCTSLQRVDFGTNSQLQTIGSSAFSDCTSLTTITIPERVTSIGDSAFNGCHALAIVYNNSGLSITAGNTGNGYVGCYAKEVVTNGQAEGNITEENNIFYYNNGSTKIALGPKGERSSITSVTLATDTTEINEDAFRGCSALQTVDFNNCQITLIPEFAFLYCSSLTTITIPETVTSIDQRAFEDCANLQYNTDGEGMYLGSATNPYFALIDTQTTTFTSITINPSCKIIADGALSDCRSLTTITIPNTVTSIGDWAFYGCSSLTTVVIEGQDVYTNATSSDACGYLLRYAQTVKVLSTVVEAGTNSYLTNTSYFPHTWVEGEYTVFSENPQSWWWQVANCEVLQIVIQC